MYCQKLTSSIGTVLFVRTIIFIVEAILNGIYNSKSILESLISVNLAKSILFRIIGYLAGFYLLYSLCDRQDEKDYIID